MGSEQKFLGIFVHPLNVQSEGIQQVFNNLEAVGATAIATIPRIGRLAAPGKGKRIPDLHMDGYRRILARPVWGLHELRVDLYPSFDPDGELYRATKYQPRFNPIPPGLDRTIPQQMMAEAKRRGMQFYLQLHPFLPPGILPEDQVVYPDGNVPQPPQVALNGDPCSPDVREYGWAIIRDSLREFDQMDGLFLDWAEYGAYVFEDIFTSLSPHSAQIAEQMGYDWGKISRAVKILWKKFHSLQSSDWKPADNILQTIWETVPEWWDFLSFKAAVITGYYRKVRDILDQNQFAHAALMARGWAPPCNRFSGLDYQRLAEFCGAVTPKLFSFDYCALPRWYGRTLKKWNPALGETEILDALVAWLDLPDRLEHRTFDQYVIKSENEPYPVGVAAYRRRIEAVMADVSGKWAKVQPFAHAYMPDEMWREKVAMLEGLDSNGYWIQMYGYLSDSKFRILREVRS